MTPFIAVLLGSIAHDKIKSIEKQTHGHLTRKVDDTVEAAVKRVLDDQKHKDLDQN